MPLSVYTLVSSLMLIMYNHTCIYFGQILRQKMSWSRWVLFGIFHTHFARIKGTKNIGVKYMNINVHIASKKIFY